MSTPIGRRGFLQLVVVTAGIAATGCSSGDDARPAPPATDGRQYFPQSVASGDPRPSSIVLWTRVEDPARAAEDVALTLEVATTAEFATLVAAQANLLAAAANDGTLKVKVQGLAARTTYYYRFVYEKDGVRYASQTGRTRTAPAPADETPVRLAIASCQDYIGRYYHAWQRLLDVDPDLDAVVFLGDYVYETTSGAKETGAEDASRRITLSDTAGAIDLDGEGQQFAAKSLANYRELYKQFKTDPVLQELHERWPLILTWDDHEFSDDSHGATATYTDGVASERDEERKRNAERAFHEFTPIDPGDAGQGPIDASAAPVYPNTKIYRDFELGKNVRLLMTDFRTYRPDHLIPEDAYPGTVIVDDAEMKAAGLDALFASDAFAYIDIDHTDYAAYKLILSQANETLAERSGQPRAAGAARVPNDVKGNLALVFVNAVLAAAGLDPIDPAGKPRGIAWVHFGKQALWDRRGSRYIVLKDTFDAWSAYVFAKTGGKSENAYGDAQDAWLKQKLVEPKPWKIVASSVSLTQMVFDLRDKADITESALRNRFYANTDGWDGFPNKKKELLGAGAAATGTIFVAGDIHASFVSNEAGAPCITAPSITSETFQDLLRSNVTAAGFKEDHPVYKHVVTDIDATMSAGNPGMVYADNAHHGVVVLELGAAEATATYHLLPSADVALGYDKAAEVKARFIEKKFRIAGGKVTAA